MTRWIALGILATACTRGGPPDTATEQDADPDTDADTQPDTSLAGLDVAVSWTDDRMDLTVTGATVVWFGMAGTGQGVGGWYGEDCLAGQGGYALCHPISGTTLVLTTTGQPDTVVAGSSTLFDATEQAAITYAVWSDTDACATWGDDPTYYVDHAGCVEVTP